MPPLRANDVEGTRCVHGEDTERRSAGTLRGAFDVGRIQGVKRLFTLGQLVATPGALAAIGVSGDDLSTYLARHQSGDWGEIDAHDRKENQLSLEHSFRLMSVYSLNTGVKIWVITEADRSSTTVLLPDEY